jgi:hypothetical protein
MFLGNPCPCGWALDDIDEETQECEKCGRRVERRDGYSVVVRRGAWAVEGENDPRRSAVAREGFEPPSSG